MDETDKTAIEQRIREHAYSLWEADGRPDGRAEEYWKRAREQLGAGGQAGSTRRPGGIIESLEEMLPKADIPDHSGKI